MSDAEKEAAIEDALHAAGYVLCGECARSKCIGRDLTEYAAKLRLADDGKEQ